MKPEVWRSRTSGGLAGVAAVAAIVFAAPPARSEVRLTGEAGGNYRVAVMSWWEIPFRSVVRQQYDFSCGSAAVATLLSHHYGRPTPEREAFADMWAKGDQPKIQKVGFSMFDMREFLRSVGYQAEGFRLNVEELGQTGRPAIVLLDLKGFKHFVVVKGVKEGKVLLGDPMQGLTEYKASDFEKAWNGIALAVTEAPSAVKPKFNLASDWGPWSKAPLEDSDGALHVAAGDLTNHLPPSYQIIPQILLEVNVGTVK